MHVFVKITYCSFLGCSQESIEGLICFTFPESNLKGMKGDTQLNQKLKKKKINKQQPTMHTHKKSAPPPKQSNQKKDKEKKENLGQSKNQHLLT